MNLDDEVASDAFDAVFRLVTGDLSQIYQDTILVLVGICLLVTIWYVTFYTLKLNNAVQTITINQSQGGNEEGNGDEIENVEHNNIIILDVPIPNAEFIQPNRDADYRAAGDGWEGDEDIDYLVGDDPINHGYDEEDSDDEVSILRRIIMEANNNASAVPENAIAISRDGENRNTSNSNTNVVAVEETPHTQSIEMDRFDSGPISVIDDVSTFSDTNGEESNNEQEEVENAAVENS